MTQVLSPSLIDRLYKAGLLIKGFDGMLELVGGVLLLVLSSDAIVSATKFLTGAELGEDPHDFLALHARHIGEQLAQGNHTFAAIFLLTHGAVKVGLVAGLLLKKLWAYPVGLVGLSALLLYQVYQLIVGPSAGIIVLTIFDVIVIWLVWREWQLVRAKQLG